MRKRQWFKVVLLAGLLLTILLTSLSTISVAAPAQGGARYCQCVEYAKNRFGLSGSAGRAKDMGSFLKARGFRQISNPQVGAVVIFQPSFGKGIDQGAGHVGVITQVSSVDRDRQWQVTVRGANQGGSLFTEYSCNNVSNVRFKSYPKGSSSISYWIC
jgi:surface antigen